MNTRNYNPFRFLDTETANRYGHGEAFLILVDDEKDPGAVKHLEYPKSFDEIFNFLAGKLATPCKYCAYNMNFDARAIFHDTWISPRSIENLGLTGRAKWRGYSFRYISGKFFECRKAGRSFIIYDLKQFFGMSLAKATAIHCPDLEKLEIPKSWYGRLDLLYRKFRLRPRILKYARRDVLGGAALLKILLQSLDAIGVRPARLSSCASIARKFYGEKLAAVRAPDYVNKIFQHGFFGGRIETRTLGLARGVSLWDLNAAYPSVIATMKNPATGEHIITRGDGWRFSSADYGLYSIEAYIPISLIFGPLAVKEKGKVLYPVGVVRTYCGAQGIAALRSAGIRFKVFYAYEIFDCAPEPILNDIPEMYKKRKDSRSGLAIKLAMNSIYGLLAEATNYLKEDSDGERVISGRRYKARAQFGRLTNFVLASHITESCRMRLWEVMRAHPEAVHFAATDGLLMNSSVRLKTGPGLGEWSLKGDYKTAVTLGCGRYLLRARDGKETYHLRGFPLRRDIFDKLKKTRRKWANIETLDTQSLRQWAGDLGADDFNVLAPRWKRLKVNDDKRAWEKRLATVGAYFRGSISSKPWIIADAKKINLCFSDGKNPDTRKEKRNGKADKAAE